jgi:hypothetical protein
MLASCIVTGGSLARHYSTQCKCHKGRLHLLCIQSESKQSAAAADIQCTEDMHYCQYLRLLFLQAHRETEAHFTAAGMSSQRNQSDFLGTALNL